MTFRVFSVSIHFIISTYLQQQNWTPFQIFVKLHTKYYSLLYTTQNIQYFSWRYNGVQLYFSSAPVHSALPIHLILLYLKILIIIHEYYKLWKSLECSSLHPSVMSSLLHPATLSNLSNTMISILPTLRDTLIQKKKVSGCIF